MNRDDILRWAREAGVPMEYSFVANATVWHLHPSFERFANLVAAAAKVEEREAILGVVKAMHDRESRGPEHPVKRYQDAFGWNSTRKDAVYDVLRHIRARGQQ